MKRREHTNTLLGQPSTMPWMLVLALLFFSGIFISFFVVRQMPSSAFGELTSYIEAYIDRAETQVRPPATVLSTAILYLRYPFAAFILGFFAIGAVLVPCMTVAFGFFLSFSIFCFTISFGSAGIWLASVLFGLRCAVTLPCYFLLAAHSWRSSVMSLGKARVPRTHNPAVYWIILAILICGICLDFGLSPQLLQIVWHGL